MNKRLFGMHHLNITQSRYGGYSHNGLNAYDLGGEDSGIDFFIAQTDYKVVGILPYNSTRFNNTVFFYDAESGCTLAMTHMDNLSQYKLGQIIHKGEKMYQEGSFMGGKNGCGNHIHLELAHGLQTYKIKDAYGNWCMRELFNIEDYFYLDDSITVIDSKGINFNKKDTTMNINIGYNKVTWRGKTIHVYLQNDNQKIGIISSNSVARLHRLDDDRTHYCKINGGYFDLSTWVHYGVEQGSILDNAPKKESLEVVYLRKDSKLIERCRASDYWYRGEDVEFALTPFATIYDKGCECCYRTTDYTNKLNSPNSQTFLVQLKSGRLSLQVVERDMTPQDCLTFAKECWGDELYHLSIYDSGGSSQMIVNGKYVFESQRAIANCITLYEGKPVLSDSKPNTSDLGEDNTIEYWKTKYNEKCLELDDMTRTAQGLRDKLMMIKDIVG